MNERVTGFVRGLVRKLGMTGTLPSGSGPATTIGEILPLAARPASSDESRLNVVLPSINSAHYFGGIHTAVSLYRELLGQFPRSRILITDSAPDASGLARFPDHAMVPMELDSSEPRQIVACNDRYGRTLPVGRGDVWLATAWWTAYAVQRLAAWQVAQGAEERGIAYLVQDYEPGFYPWSSQHALALSTYRPDRDFAIFNTGLLAAYFVAQGIHFLSQATFEPTINDGLRPALDAARASARPREKRIVVYARPSTPRNAFELLCEGLSHWGWADPRSGEWSVVAVGELAGDVDLGPFRLQALGKLDIDQYAELLATSAVGGSLMVSPHPSYPPLEMAAFGMSVVTNEFANKTASDFSSNIRYVSQLSPETLASAIGTACSEFEARSMRPATIMDAGHRFLAPNDLMNVVNPIRSHWRRPKTQGCTDG